PAAWPMKRNTFRTSVFGSPSSDSSARRSGLQSETSWFVISTTGGRTGAVKVTPDACRFFATRGCSSCAILGPRSLSIRFLGTSASRPPVERGVCSLALVREGETLLFDCGEGTQRQMMRYGITFALDDVFFTHFHTDHVLGIVGLVRTFQLGGRTEVLRLWGPRGADRVLRQHIFAGGSERLSYDLDIRELAPGDVVPRNGYDIRTFDVDHRGAQSLGYAVVEHERLGR